MGDGNFRWYVGYGREPEIYQIAEDTRDAALQAARNDQYDDPCYGGFTLVEADKSVMTANIDGDGIAERVMEELCENNEECFGEDGPDDPWAHIKDAHRSLGQAIEEAVEIWLAVNPGKTWCFGTTRNAEYFPPAG